MKRAVITVVGVSVVVAGLCVGAWAWASANHDSTPVSSSGGSVPISGGGGTEGGSEQQVSMNAQGSAQSTTPTPTPSKAVATNTTISGNSSVSAGPSPASLPGPSGFSVYEQYKTSKNALYVEEKPGAGTAAAAGNTITVQYRGWLTNGQEFDESYSRNQPFSFVMGAHSVILGWEQGLAGMKVGGKRRLIIPPAVGYGNTVTGSIPAGSLLVFDVELVGVK